MRKASKKIFMIRNLRRYGCDSDLMIKAYQTFIRPVLTYAFAAYCNAPEYLLKELIKVERRVFRIMGIEYCEDLNVISHATLICRNLFCAILNNESHPLRDLFHERQVLASTRSDHCYLRPPRTKTRRFARSFVKFCK